jgi:hypothetical protein
LLMLFFSLPLGAQSMNCDEVTKIREIPFKPDLSVNDQAYNSLKKKGREVVPCLIERIPDTKVTVDPRGIPGPKNCKVGDVAFWVILDITNLPYDDMFPETLRKRFADEGVYAYHEWVRKKSNRKLLQVNVRKWYEANKPKVTT